MWAAYLLNLLAGIIRYGISSRRWGLRQSLSAPGSGKGQFPVTHTTHQVREKL